MKKFSAKSYEWCSLDRSKATDRNYVGDATTSCLRRPYFVLPSALVQREGREEVRPLDRTLESKSRVRDSSPTVRGYVRQESSKPMCRTSARSP